jgi:hypothetical protein
MPDLPPSASLPEPESDFEARLKLYEVFRGYIKHEDGLIDNRVTWLSQIHGLLYATYGFTLLKKIEIMQQVSSHVDESTSTFVYMSRSHLGSGGIVSPEFLAFNNDTPTVISRERSVGEFNQVVDGIGED